VPRQARDPPRLARLDRRTGGLCGRSVSARARLQD